MFHSKQWHYSLHRDFQNCYSTRRSLTQDSSAPIPAPIPAPILHVHSTENSTCRRQRALRVLQSSSRNSIRVSYKTFQANSSCSRDIPDIPVIHDLPAFQAILQCSSISRESTPFQHSPIRMHILQFYSFYSSIGFQKTPPSTSWAITDITNIHSFFKEREMLRYRSNVHW